MNGVAIFNGYNSGCCDATFVEIQSMDFCMGHPANGGYHYHYFAKNTEGMMIEEYNVFIYEFLFFRNFRQ